MLSIPENALAGVIVVVIQCNWNCNGRFGRGRREGVGLDMKKGVAQKDHAEILLDCYDCD